MDLASRSPSVTCHASYAYPYAHAVA